MDRPALRYRKWPGSCFELICVKGSRAFLNHTTGGLVRDESVVYVWDVSVCMGWVEYVMGAY